MGTEPSVRVDSAPGTGSPAIPAICDLGLTSRLSPDTSTHSAAVPGARAEREPEKRVRLWKKPTDSCLLPFIMAHEARNQE